MDVTPVIAAGRQVIERYGEGRFKITGEIWPGSVLVRPTATLPLALTQFSDLTLELLLPLFAADAEPLEILLIGCGRQMRPLPAALRAEIRKLGPVADTMDTGAACRTYNILMAEGRRVAAVLMVVD
jgi:uncharacterized protein